LWLDTWTSTWPDGSIRNVAESYPKMIGTCRFRNSVVVWAVCSV